MGYVVIGLLVVLAAVFLWSSVKVVKEYQQVRVNHCDAGAAVGDGRRVAGTVHR